MTLPEVIQTATTAPAAALRRPDLGRLAAGGIGDASVLALEEGPVDLEDVEGAVVRHDARLVARGTVIGGRWEPGP